MAKPYKLKDGNGSLRDHTGQYSAPGKPAPRSSPIYPGQQASPIPTTPSLQADQMPARSPQKTFGAPAAPAKPFTLKDVIDAVREMDKHNPVG